MLRFFISLHRNQIASSSDAEGIVSYMRPWWGKEITIFAIQNSALFRVFCVDCGNIKFHCNMWMDRTNSFSMHSAMHPMISLLFFSGDYHFCILLSDSFIGIYAVFRLHPRYRLAFNSLDFLFRWFRANFWQLNCELSTQWLGSSGAFFSFDVFVTICWLRTRTFVIVSFSVTSIGLFVTGDRS